MKKFFWIVKYGLIIHAIISIFYKIAFQVFDRERLSLLKYLDNNSKIEAYYFRWYEGIAYSVDLWLVGNDYLHIDQISDFNQVSDSNLAIGNLEKIGDLLIRCTNEEIHENNIDVYQGINIFALKVANGDEPIKSVDDIIRQYADIYNEIAKFPTEASEGENEYEHQARLNGYQCVSERGAKPKIPLYQGVKSKFGSGHFFHYKNH